MSSLGGHLWEVAAYESLRLIRSKFCLIAYMAAAETYLMTEMFYLCKIKSIFKKIQYFPLRNFHLLSYLEMWLNVMQHFVI